MRILRSGRRRIIAHRVALVAASTMAAVAVGEVFIRAVAPAYVAIQTDREMWEHDPKLGWRIRPSIDVLQLFDRGRRVPVTINSHGFREREVQPKSGPGTTRIMVLGDSFAFGFGVPVEHRLSEVVEQARADLVCENFGVSGYSTDQELLVYSQQRRRVAPDIVVLMYVANDPWANASLLGHGHPKPMFALEEGRLALTNVPVPQSSMRRRLKWTLLRNSAFFNLIRERTEIAQGWLGSLLSHERVPQVATYDGPALNKLQYGHELTRQLILELKREIEDSGARLIVMNSVSTANLESNDPDAVRLGEWCRLNDILWVDTYPAFRLQIDLDPNCDLFIRDRHHWNADGHRLAAGCLLQALKEWKLVPARRAQEDQLNAMQ